MIFYTFFCSGEGKGESGATGRGGGQFFCLKTTGRGVLPRGAGGGGRGRGGVCREFGGGGWLNIFLSCRNARQDFIRFFPHSCGSFSQASPDSSQFSQF